MTKWVTISEASVILGMSERTVWRRISEGLLEAKSEDNKRLVKVEVPDDMADVIGMTVSDTGTLIKWLKKEVGEKNEMLERLKIELNEKSNQIKSLEEEIKSNRERSDAIIMRLAEELEAQRLVFEGKQPKDRSNESFWKRFAKRLEL